MRKSWSKEPATRGACISDPQVRTSSAGQAVFEAGTTLGPGHLGVLCSVGCENVAVVLRLPSSGVLSTGDELVEGGARLQPGQIRDSNRRTIISLLRRDGFVAVDLGIARDHEADIERVLVDGVTRCDAVITSGGVSMGDFDFVKSVLDRIGRMHWMQVAIRPAKPFAFGLIGQIHRCSGCQEIPCPRWSGYEVLARPGLRRMAGRSDSELRRPPVEAVVDDEGWRSSSDGRTTFVRVRAAFGEGGKLRVSSTGGQGSHQLYAMALADSLATYHRLQLALDASRGDTVQVLLLGP